MGKGVKVAVVLCMCGRPWMQKVNKLFTKSGVLAAPTLRIVRCSGPHGTGPAGSTIPKGQGITHMTITRSLRPFAAAALAAGLVLPAAASAAGRSTGTGHGNVSHASSYSSYQRHTVDGVPQTMSGTTAPATLTVHMASGTTITVTMSARTTVLRGHGGRSGLAELTVGDRITADGSFATGSSPTFDARRLTD